MSDEYSNSPLTFGMPSTRVVVTPTSLGRWTGAGGTLARGCRGDRHGVVSSAPASRRLARSRSCASPSSPTRAQLAVAHDRAAADEQQLDRARRAQDERGDGIGDAGVLEPVEPPQRDVGELAGLERAELVVAAEAARAVDRRERQRLARGHRRRPAGEAGEEQRLAQLERQLTGLVGGGAVDAEADRRARAA